MSSKGSVRSGSERSGPVSGASVTPSFPEERYPEVADVVRRGEAAWPRFLRRYTGFILACIRRFSRDHDERMEIYVHVCRRLHADDCRRIRQFRGGRGGTSCKFTTWLAAVVFNMAREWIRSARGRRRMFRVVREMSRTDRLIFRYYFWEGRATEEIAELLSTHDRIPMSGIDVRGRLGKIERRLTRDHRWRLVTSLLRSVPPMSLEQSRVAVQEDGPVPPVQVADERPDPETRARHRHASATLRRLVAELPDRERQAIQLKFGRGMTARAVAQALGIGNYKRIYEIQARALSRLARRLDAAGVGLDDFDVEGNLEDLLPVSEDRP